MDANISYSNLTNRTTEDRSPGTSTRWNSEDVLEVIILISATFLNGVVILAFLRNRSLRNPFNIYIMTLTAVNLICAISDYPFGLAFKLYGTRWLTAPGCYLHMYGDWVFSLIPMYMHLLISISRIWAIFKPISFRNRHTKKIASLLVFWSCLYVHCLCLPDVVRFAVLYPNPEATECEGGDIPYAWSVANMMLASNLPVVVIIGAYPFLLQERQRRHRKVARLAMQFSNSTKTTSASGQAATSQQLAVPRVEQARSTESDSAWVVLTLLTLSVLVCYVPSQVYWTALTIVPDLETASWIYPVTVSLYRMEAAMDPILFMAAMKNLREAVWKIVRNA